MKKDSQGGYIGILSILLVAILIAWIAFMKSDKTPEPATESASGAAENTFAPPVESSSYIESNLKAIDKARDAKAGLEQSSWAIEEGGY
jgi:hypothetical protein